MIFSEFWVINQNGIALFYLSNGKEILDTMQMELMSGLFSAIQTLAQYNINENLKIITFDKTKMIFTTDNEYPELFFVCRGNLRIKNNIAIRELKKMGKLFISEYKDILGNWTGDTDIFIPFENLLVNRVVNA